MTQLVTQEGGWPFRPDKCPADEDIIHWLNPTTLSPVIHMGSGEHHEVGKNVSGRGLLCLSMTVSVEEMAAYVKWAIENPEQASRYQCLFADVQSVSSLHLGQASVIALPHLGEMPDERRDDPQQGYGRSIAATLDVMYGCLFPRGYLLLYTRSAAWGRIQPEIQALEASGKYERQPDFRSLAVYRKL